MRLSSWMPIPVFDCFKMIQRVAFLIVCLPLLVATDSLAQGPRTSESLEPPNIVWLLADDLGWTDLHCYGSQYYETPHLDQLCQAGVKFTDAYTCGPNCAPTRACLMTGLYPPRHGIYTVGSGARGKATHRQLVPVENRTELSLDFMTISELLSDAGYVTAHFGKWHLGDPGTAGPGEQGFDVNVGGFHAGHPKSYFSPYNNPYLPDGPAGECLTDRLAREVVDFVQANRDKRFLAYVPFYAVHTPIQAKRVLTKKYQAQPTTAEHNNPKYAAMVETLDSAVGQILKCLDELELSDSTIVIFSSDNGGLGGYRDAGVSGGQEITSQKPLRGGKGMLYEGGVRVPLIVCWPGHTQPGTVCRTPVTSVDFLPTLAAIAQCNDTPENDGVNLVPLLEGKSNSLASRALYWHFPGYLEANARQGTWRTTPAGAIRAGNWKLIEFFEDGRLELYNLADDIGEQHNLSKQHPDVCQDLHQQLRQWRQAVDAPLPTRASETR